jgi:hypothetical protein
VAAKRTYKRDKRGRFASSGTTRIKRAGRKINRRRPRYLRGSVGKTVRVGRVGPGGEYAGIHPAFTCGFGGGPGWDRTSDLPRVKRRK